MRNNSLQSARAKIERAKYHLAQLNDEIKRDGEAKKYGISFRHKLQTDELIMNALMPNDLFTRYSIIAGEVVGHARSALEHAVWEIVPSPDEGRTGFPVFRLETKADRVKSNDKYYDRDGISKIKDINTAAATIIKAEQPFGPNYQTNLLYILNELWNIDKHRLLNSCLSYPRIAGLIFTFPDGHIDGTRFINFPTDIKDGTELFREPHPGANVEVIAEVDFSGVVFKGGPVDGKPLPELLLTLVEFSDRIIDDLAKTA